MSSQAWPQGYASAVSSAMRIRRPQRGPALHCGVAAAPPPVLPGRPYSAEF